MYYSLEYLFMLSISVRNQTFKQKISALLELIEKKFKSSSIYHVIAHSNVCPMKTIFQKLQVDKSLIMVCLQN